MVKHVFGLAALTVLVALGGCGAKHLPDRVPVSGTVTFDGQPPPNEGMITFAPLEVAEGKPRRPGLARFAADGRFEVGSWEQDDGLVPGTYRVQVECWKVVPTMDKPGVSYVSDQYQPTELAVGPDVDTTDVKIEVPKAK